MVAVAVAVANDDADDYVHDHDPTPAATQEPVYKLQQLTGSCNCNSNNN